MAAARLSSLDRPLFSAGMLTILSTLGILKPPKWRRHLAIKADPSRILRSTGAFSDSHRDAVVVDTLAHQRRRGNGGRPRTPCRSSKPEPNTPPPDDVFSAFVRLLFDGIRPLLKQWLPFFQDNYPEHSQEPFQFIPNVYYL